MIESLFHPAHDRDVGWAIRAMKAGHRVRRSGWRQPRNWWVVLYRPAEDERGMVTQWPFFIKHWTDGTAPWAPTPADLLAEDWELAL